MIRTWKMLAVAALVLFVVASRAPAGGEADTKKLLESLGKLHEKVDAIQTEELKQRKELQQLNAKLKQFEEDLAKVRDKLNDAPPVPVPGAGLDKAALEDLHRRLVAIEKALAALGSSKDRISLFPPINGGVGRLMLTNLYGEAMSFVINNRTYRVEPNQTVELREMPAGVVNYEVFSERWGPRGRKTTTLEPNTTITLFIQ
jgi:hypothetical protein